MAERLKFTGVKHTFLTLPEEDYLFDRQMDKKKHPAGLCPGT